ncbi:MAG: alpha/beta hydrolase [Acidobacteria bacterium]|nr:alpha/beta hydrolase [Acidobacteriota bacterium]
MKRVVLALIVALLALLLSGVWYVWKRPLAVLAWGERRNLAKNGFQKTALSTPNGEMTVWEAGSGPTVVLLHGAGDQAGAWSIVVPDLTGKYWILIPDLAGHGESAPAAGPLKLGTILAGVETLVHARGKDQPVVLVGNSMGAWLAMVYAHRHPERVARVVAVNGGALHGDYDPMILLPPDREAARKLMEMLRDPDSLKTPDFVLDDVVRHARNGPMGRMFSGKDFEQFLLDGKLGEMRVPVDIIWGESDRLIPLDYAKRMAAQLPAARITTLPRCGHVPQRECPSSLIAALEKVLKEPPPGPRPAGAATTTEPPKPGMP